MLGSNPERKRLKAILEERSQEVLQRFREATISEIKNKELLAIMEEVNANWKDLQRPALASFSCEAVGGQPTMTDNASLAITLASAGMGIHDDIIDKSNHKHLRKTIVGKYGADKALLVGDLLMIKGLTNARDRLQRMCPREKREAVLEAFEDYFFEIYEGELMDISCRKNLDVNIEDYLKVLRKLVADGEVCARIGAIMGSGSENEIETLAEYGRRLGMIIILGEEVRDTLNLEGNLPHRLEYESVPLPILYAAKSSGTTYEKINSFLRSSSKVPRVFGITELCWRARAMNYVCGLAKKEAHQATHKLEMLKPSAARDVLFFMIEVALHDIKKASSFERQYFKHDTS